MAAAADAARPAAAQAGSGSGRDHVVVFPFMAKGHTLPLLHLASALAAHPGGGLRVTVVTTPGNLAFARRRLPAAARVALVSLPFPSHADLPAGVESTDALPSQNLFPAFLRATALLREPFAAYLASLPAPPLALVSDFFLGFTQRVAADAGVPRLTFHGMSTFSLALCFSLATNPPPAGAAGPFRVKGFPESVTVAADEVPHAVAQAADADNPVTRFLQEEVRGWDYKSWGVLVNSFDALDGDYAAVLESFYLPGARAWLVGPLFLLAAAAAGESSSPECGEDEDEESEDPEGCLAWLDERRAGSVVYVSFGTQAEVTAAQLEELAHGLVGSGHAFLWAVRVRCSGGGDAAWSPPVEVENAGPHVGKVVRGWVPQRRVLAHRAVGGFVSHCGWNSVLESLAAGRPLLAWPVMAEQAAGRQRQARGGHPRRRRARGGERRRRGDGGRKGAGGGEGPGADGRRRGRAEDARRGRARPGGGAGGRRRGRILPPRAAAVGGRAAASLRRRAQARR